MTAAPRVLALATLLAVGAQTLSNGGANGRHAAAGVERYTKLDRFLHDRMGLTSIFGGGVGNRSGLSAPTTDRGLLSRTPAASAAVPEDEDDDGADNEDDGDDDDDEDDEEDLQNEKDEVTPEPFVRLRHRNAAAAAAAVAAEKDLNVYGKDIQKHEPARTMSPISENKWKLFGSRKNVEETFRSSQKISLFQGQGDNEGSEAYKHQLRISKEASCKVPRSRVIKVTDVYPSSNKKYLPACTILHVCAEDTGCCNSPTLKCGPKTSQPIYLPFLVYTLPGLGDRQSPEQSSYQKSLLFYNHTECECQSRTDDLMPRDTLPTTSMATPDPPQLFRHRTDKNYQYNCKCPTEYTVRYLANGSCSCDCFDKQRECIRYKKGNVYFNHLDRYCITSGQCLLPTCEYGVYSSRTGRCPKQFETLYSLNKKHYF
uniref:Platelet-derived growth factor (PDGF) family profile domain-containing protein n=1 Tax=Schizaphis graminum TaxID=13262 RepID=A0A2S2NWL5_SCHGA